jgi:tetratricopeptide (TPR) repeat protein
MTASESTPPAPLSTPRKLLFSAVAVCLGILALEISLALLGVAPRSQTEDPFVGFASSSPLFVSAEAANGDAVFVTAPNKRGYFNLQSFAAKKQSGVRRIFCLGGSTTYGRPYADATSFVGWLRELLPLAEPGVRFEVINAGGISYASYRVARVFDELLDYEPDALVVYTGHNEFLEERTYSEFRDRAAWRNALIRIASRSRVGEAVARALRQDASDVSTDGRAILATEVQARLDHSAGLDLYSRDDELASDVLRHYRHSLEQMAHRAGERGVPLIFVTPASNLAGFRPFKAESSAELDPEPGLREARALLDAGDAAGAREVLVAVRKADPRQADVLFELGRVLRALGDYDAAKEMFIAARDEDVCTLRAPSKFVQAVREIAADREVPCVDYVSLLEEESRRRFDHALVGEEFFLDHVHPTIEAHRLLALKLVDALHDARAIDARKPLDSASITPVVERVEGSVSIEEHSRALANLALTLSWAGKHEDSRRLADRALESGVEDPTILLMAARHATLSGDHDAAYAYFHRAEAAKPGDAVIQSQMGFFLAGRQEFDAAAAHFFLASLLWDDNETYHQQLGYVLGQRGRLDVAALALQKATALAPQNESIARQLSEVKQRWGTGPLPQSADPLVTRHSSGFPRTIAQAVVGADGTAVAHGLFTEWHDGGHLAGVADFEMGRQVGERVAFDLDGRRLGATAPR